MVGNFYHIINQGYPLFLLRCIRYQLGQRRRVQLVMGLLAPWDMLLLDEVTVDLDVLVRSDFLDYLEKETAARNSSIVS